MEDFNFYEYLTQFNKKQRTDREITTDYINGRIDKATFLRQMLEFEERQKNEM